MKKQQLQKRASPLSNSPLQFTEKSPQNLRFPKNDDMEKLFTPSPLRQEKSQGSFRKKLTSYHNNFMENVNNTLLISNSYSKNFKEKEIFFTNSSNLAKTKSEINLLNKSHQMGSDFFYKEEFHSNTNLNGLFTDKCLFYCEFFS